MIKHKTLVVKLEKFKEIYNINDFNELKDYEWRQISKIQISESFIEKYQDKIYWDLISEYQKLSESFIKKFKDKVNWINISRYQIHPKVTVNK